jgi:hypothetical protein
MRVGAAWTDKQAAPQLPGLGGTTIHSDNDT